MWVSVTKRGELIEGVMRPYEVAGKNIVVVLNAGKTVAFNGLCPHASAALVEGDIRPTYVICPLHNYRFDLNTGRCLKPPDGPRLKIYPAEWRDDILWVDIEAKG